MSHILTASRSTLRSRLAAGFMVGAIAMFTMATASAGHHAKKDYKASEKYSKNIVETAVSAGSFNTLVAALQATGLDKALADENGTFTVFAPTDEAFAELGDETIKSLLNDPEALSEILLYHVVGTQKLSGALAKKAGQSVTTLAGGDLTISRAGKGLNINSSTVAAADIKTSNGVIHVIDKVLLPPKAM